MTKKKKHDRYYYQWGCDEKFRTEGQSVPYPSFEQGV